MNSCDKIFSALSLWDGEVLGTEKSAYLQRKESAFSFVHNIRKLPIIHKQRTEKQENIGNGITECKL